MLQGLGFAAYFKNNVIKLIKFVVFYKVIAYNIKYKEQQEIKIQ
jgi:hypothetical protein